MKHPDNINALAHLPIDYMGMVFYAPSPRNNINGNPEMLEALPATIKKTGVFVDESREVIKKHIRQYNLEAVQLHGTETPAQCQSIKQNFPFLEIIKAFSIANADDFERTKQYEGTCDYFLFDTKTPQHGGSGKKFDWQLLDNYNGNTLFFLSGGISVDDIDSIKALSHPNLYALDLNSKFETEPGLKDIELLKRMIRSLREDVSKASI